MTTPMAGGEDPFPLRSRTLPGGGNPFPLNVKVNQQTVGRWIKGSGSYTARQIGPFVDITATGMLNYLDADAQLVKSPLTVFPPIYGLFFFIPQIGLPAEKPFTVTASFFSDGPVQSVSVCDAEGKHEVSVTQLAAEF